MAGRNVKVAGRNVKVAGRNVKVAGRNVKVAGRNERPLCSAVEELLMCLLVVLYIGDEL